MSENSGVGPHRFHCISKFNFQAYDIYSLVTYIVLLKNIFSETVVYFQKAYPNINGIFTCASIFERLSSPSNHITPGVTNFLNNLNIGSNIH
jgi:hypothetical protein